MFRPPGLARQAIGILASSRELMNEAQPMRMANGGDVDVIETYLAQARRMAEAQGLRPGSMLYNQVVGTLYNQLSSTKPSVSQLFPPRAPEPQPVDVSTPMTRQAFPRMGVGSFRGLQTPDVDSAPLGDIKSEPVDVSIPFTGQAFPRPLGAEQLARGVAVARGTEEFQEKMRPDDLAFNVKTRNRLKAELNRAQYRLDRAQSRYDRVVSRGNDETRAEALADLIEARQEVNRLQPIVTDLEKSVKAGQIKRTRNTFSSQIDDIDRQLENDDISEKRRKQLLKQREGLLTRMEEKDVKLPQAEEEAAAQLQKQKEDKKAIDRKAAAQTGDAPAMPPGVAPVTEAGDAPVMEAGASTIKPDLTDKEREIIAPEYQKFLQTVIAGGGNMQEADKNFYLMMFGLSTAAGESDNPLLNITKAARDTLLAYATEKREIEKSNFVRRLEASKALGDIKLAEAQVNKPGTIEENMRYLERAFPGASREELLIRAGAGKDPTRTDTERYGDLAVDISNQTMEFTQKYFDKDGVYNKKAPASAIKQLREDATRFIAMTVKNNKDVVELQQLDGILFRAGLTPPILKAIGLPSSNMKRSDD